MSTDALRAELEAVYNAAVAAVKSRDFDAFIAVVQPPRPGIEDAMRADFADAAAMFAQAIPDLSLTTFVVVRTEGDDLAGYYHARINPAQPTQAQVILSRFVRVEGRWKLLLSGTFHVFKHGLDDDVRAMAQELAETHPSLQLRKPSDAP